MRHPVQFVEKLGLIIVRIENLQNLLRLVCLGLTQLFDSAESAERLRSPLSHFLASLSMPVPGAGTATSAPTR